MNISHTLHKAAKATAALRDITLRELVEQALEKELLPGKPSAKGKEADKASEEAPKPSSTNKALEDALAAQLEKENARMQAEHEDRIARGLIKG